MYNYQAPHRASVVRNIQRKISPVSLSIKLQEAKPLQVTFYVY